MQKIVYIDLDGVVANFDKGKQEHPLGNVTPYIGKPDAIPGIYENLEPIDGAIKSVNILLDAPEYDVYFLSTAPWDNPEAWTHKRLWIDQHFETKKIRKRLILSHQKHLMIGDYLIDDRPNNGAKDFQGEWLHFGENGIYKTWPEVMDYLKERK